MAVGRDGYRWSQVAGCLPAAEVYLLTAVEAREIIDHQVDIITREWNEAADAARLTTAERQHLWRRQILNPYALEDW